MNDQPIRGRLGFVVALGAAWGFAECVLGAGLQACARSVSGSAMTGAAIFFIAAAWAVRKKAGDIALLVGIAVLFKAFDALLLGPPLTSGAVANPAFAFVLEGAGFLVAVAVLARLGMRKTTGRALVGGAAALLAVAAFPLIGFVTGNAACLAAGTSIPLAWYYGPIAIALSLVTAPLGMRFGERSEVFAFRSRILVPSLALALSLALIAMFRSL